MAHRRNVGDSGATRPDLCITPGACAQVLEFCEGGDLRAALTRDEAGELAWHKRGRQIALDIARGLHFLHSHDVMHSDLKTKNILLTRDQATAKIADVGLAQFMVRPPQLPFLCAWNALKLLWGFTIVKLHSLC